MSRRTKLVTLLVALALVGFTAVEFILTWSPMNPLRFRVVTIQGAPVRFSDYTTQLGALVENTNSATIYLRGTQIVARDGTDGGDGHSGFTIYGGQGSLTGEDLELIIIPPHSSIHVHLFVTEHRQQDAKSGRLDVQYSWISSTKDKVASTYLWLLDHCPERFHDFLPPAPHYDHNITPLHAISE